MAPLMFYIAPFDKVLYSTFKDMVLYSTKSGSPMITSQEPLLVLILLEWKSMLISYKTVFARIAMLIGLYLWII